ncbi:receptor-like protein 7 [Hibiscus syriacus]|uniref:receptor-like protein 7 n=1 Tax=Hibiscus syriacus TaxID=106335 RepID=UPI0019237F2E|nr:receptor-like protein 7 [Hibiscus syriacus]
MLDLSTKSSSASNFHKTRKKTMGCSLAFALVSFMICLFQFTPCVSSVQPLCRSDERLALFQFKESLNVDEEASADPFAYPKAEGWKFQGVDCCHWDGIECDHNTGHVTALDLSSSFLYGTINSTSSLFHLVHLRKLNLADNHFNFSEIPSRLGNLSMLTYLNLSNSVFSGEIPLQISSLSRLTSLDLSNEAELECPDFRSLIRKLTNLKHLHLSHVIVSSPVPSILMNLSSLSSLDLSHCGLSGELPTSIFQLPNIQFLDVSNNLHLTGTLPATFSSRRLKFLSVGFTSFSDVLPASIGSLDSLKFLDVTACKFGGPLPSSLGNLTKLTGLALQNNSFSGDIPSSLSNLTRMGFLSLGINKFNLNTIPSWFANFNKLHELHLSFCRIKGPIPSFLANLTQLVVLDLNQNQFTGGFPVGIANLTWLKSLSLGSNMLDGALPDSIFGLQNLELLEIYSNRLSGIVEMDQFMRLKHLKVLYLSSNNFTLLSVSETSPNTSILPMFNELGLGSCNLRQFPNLLRDQNQLVYLDLSRNNIQGQVPKWIWEMSLETLLLLDLSFNSLTGFHESPTDTLLPWSNILLLDLSSNLFQGSPPIPSRSIMVYSASNNSFTGEIPQLFCSMASLQVLDLSRNNLSDIIPQCLSNVSTSLSVLNLHVNDFHGPIPQAWMSGNKLKMINLGQNKLEGKLPRSLVMCRMLEFLDIGNNRIRDTWPFWLVKSRVESSIPCFLSYVLLTSPTTDSSAFCRRLTWKAGMP